MMYRVFCNDFIRLFIQLLSFIAVVPLCQCELQAEEETQPISIRIRVEKVCIDSINIIVSVVNQTDDIIPINKRVFHNQHVIISFNKLKYIAVTNLMHTGVTEKCVGIEPQPGFYDCNDSTIKADFYMIPPRDTLALKTNILPSYTFNSNSTLTLQEQMAKTCKRCQHCFIGFLLGTKYELRYVYSYDSYHCRPEATFHCLPKARIKYTASNRVSFVFRDCEAKKRKRKIRNSISKPWHDTLWKK